jgi:hypothetical protein
LQVPDEIRKCVGFVGVKTSLGAPSSVATFFFVHHDGFSYAVTAAHVYDGVRRATVDGFMHLRLNLKVGGSVWGPTRISDWVTHPTDRGVDVAVCPVGVPGDTFDMLALPTDMALTPEIINTEVIGLGDDVFLTGLFVCRPGRDRMIPILRTGAIAAMPEEPIEWTRNTVEGQFSVSMEAYLVEARSIGGLSGSPVFVSLGGMRNIGGGAVRLAGGGPGFHLLGLMHGHWDAPPDSAAEAIATTEGSKLTDADEVREERVNMGIGIVVPIAAILAVLDQPKLKAQRASQPVPLQQGSRPTSDDPPVE